MLKIGCHLSSSKGYMKMGKEILDLGGNTFQFFTRNPRGSKAKPIDEEDIKQFKNFQQEYGIEIILAHAPYTLNACSSDEKIREFAFMTMRDDLERLSFLPGNLYNFHPGSHVKQGMEKGIENVTELLNEIITPEQSTKILLETMSGKGTEVGSRFEELKQIIDGVKEKEHIGVCLDTCHVYDAGYDIVQNLEAVIEEFDRIIGLNFLMAIHLNDSKNPFQSHKDRHEKIGEGSIGLETFEKIINHKKLRHLPFYLETPCDLDGYRKEIHMLKGLYQAD